MVTISPQDAPMGVVVTGLDPSVVSADDVAQIRDALTTRRLAVVRGMTPTTEQFLQFGRLFGSPVAYYEPMYHHPEVPEVFVSSTVATGRQVGVPRTGAFWHTDYQFMPEPFAYTLTLPIACPGADRGTHFIDQAAAFRRLPEGLRATLRRTWCRHTPRRFVKIRPKDVYRPIGEVMAEIEAVTPPQVWPTVVVHPVTGEEILYLSEAFAECLIDENGDELPRALLDEVLSLSGQLDMSDPHIHTQYICAGDVLVWDNRVLTHRACHGSTPGDVVTHRVTVVDGLPTPGLPNPSLGEFLSQPNGNEVFS